MNRRITYVFYVLALALLVAVPFTIALLPGCATNTGDPATDRRGRVANALLQSAGETLGKFAVATLQNVLTAEVNGETRDFASAAAQGAWTAGESLVTAGQVERLVNAWSGDKLPVSAAVAGQEFAKAVEAGVPPGEAAHAIASVISASTLP